MDTSRYLRSRALLLATVLPVALIPVVGVVDGARAQAAFDHVVTVGADDPGSPALPSVADRFDYHARGVAASITVGDGANP